MAHYADSLVGGGGKGVVPLIVVSIITSIIISPVESNIGIISIGEGELGIELGGGLSDLGGTWSFKLGQAKGGEGLDIRQGNTPGISRGQTILVGGAWLEARKGTSKCTH